MRSTRKLNLERLEIRSLLAAAPWKLPDFASLAPDSYSAESILVSFKDKAAADVVPAGMKLGSKVGLDANLREVRLQGLTVEAALKALAKNPNIGYAEPNWVLTKQALATDPKFTDGSLWGMYGDESSPSNQFGSQASEVWATGATGSAAVYVGIIDEGIDFKHPDLAANIWTNQFDPADGIDNDGNGFVDDIHGWDFANDDSSIYDGSAADLTIDEHGTHVAGTIGAASNTQGVAGVNWAVQMISGKFLNPGGGSTLDAINAIDYFVDLKTRHNLNIVALNNSWGGGGYSQALLDAITRAAKQNILFIAAAGNGGADKIGDNNDTTASYPSNYDTTASAGYDSVVAVGAIDSGGALGYFSNYGAKTVDLGAPGVGILSTTPGGGYLAYSGTSMATPHVTGAAALYAAQHPGATPATIRNALLDAASATPTTSLLNTTLTGGRLNIAGMFGLDADLVGPRVSSSTPSGTVLGPVSSVRVTFNEAIDPSSFTALDVTSSTLTNVTVSPVSGTNNQFDIKFTAVSSGSHSLAIGPGIADVRGNVMDQNRDGLQGGSDDVYQSSFDVGNELASTDVPAPLGGFWSITASYLTIDQDVNIADLDIKVDITHPNVGDLIVHLHDPSGKQVILSNRRGGTGDNFTGTRFDDEAATAISAGTAPFSGSFRPDQLLSQYDGRNARGTWTLYVENWGSTTGGRLNAWSMILRRQGNIPVAANDAYSTSEDTSLTIAAAGILANDTDADGDPLTAVLGSGPANGTLTLNPNGSFTYVPNKNFYGTDTFTYRASDGNANSALATVTLNVSAVNDDAPIAKSDAYSVQQDSVLSVAAPGVLANDADPDGQSLTAVLVSGPASGTLVFNADGSFNYTPAAGFAGAASFSYRATDGTLASEIVTVSIDVTSVQPVVKAQDGFDSGTFSGGTGWGTASWSKSGHADVRSDAGPQSGAYHTRLRSTARIQRGADLSNWSDVHLTFWAKVNSFESTDKATVEVSGDGGTTWKTLRTFTSADSNNAYRSYDFVLPSGVGGVLTNRFQVRFQASASNTGDYWYIDSVQLIGKAPAGTKLATSSSSISPTTAVETTTASDSNSWSHLRALTSAVPASGEASRADVSIGARRADAYFAAAEENLAYPERSLVRSKVATAVEDLLDYLGDAL